MSRPKRLHAFVDESGQRSPSEKSSDYFIMSAVLVFDNCLDLAREHLTALKSATNRKPEHLLHWSKLKPHHRSKVSEMMGSASGFMGYVSVVACKRVLADQVTMEMNFGGEKYKFSAFTPLSEDEAYLKTYQYLLERISWVASRNQTSADITIEHTIRFKRKTLEEFESRIKKDASCSAHWGSLPDGAKLRSKNDEDLLQLADLVASGIGAAFNGHPRNGVDTSHVSNMAQAMWRGPKKNKLTTYGLKMHPWNEATKSLHPWLLEI